MGEPPDLFGAGTGRSDERVDAGGTGSHGAGTGSDADDRGVDPSAPLAARMRPRSLDEVRGQEKLLGPGRPLRKMLEGGELQSCILWGPPGSGKTTLARLLANRVDAHFVAFSAVTEGVARVREIIAEARTRRHATGRTTILFCDEIHRFNRAQQDAFLPHVEEGTVLLIGATTENPSFEVNRPLLSRAPVFILEPLSEKALAGILRRAVEDRDRGLGISGLEIDPDALEFLARSADGDARRALGALEIAGRLARDRSESPDAPASAESPDGPSADQAAVAPSPRGESQDPETPVIDLEIAKDALQHRFAIYDKSGEEHFNLISALHKSVRGSHPDGALYWLARMIEGGEDPMYIARRVIRMATEDIGLADPRALQLAVAAWQSLHFLGQPEGELSLAEAVVYLATAPKSNRVYRAWADARRAARETASAPVPMNLRNAPTSHMKEWGYGEGYQYDPETPHGVSSQEILPEALGARSFYEPGGFGFEREIEKRLRWWESQRRQAKENESGDSG